MVPSSTGMREDTSSMERSSGMLNALRPSPWSFRLGVLTARTGFEGMSRSAHAACMTWFRQVRICRFRLTPAGPFGLPFWSYAWASSRMRRTVLGTIFASGRPAYLSRWRSMTVRYISIVLGSASRDLCSSYWCA